MDRVPSISDLERRAFRRVPHFSWEYLASGTGDERAMHRNTSVLAEMELLPEVFKGSLAPQTSVSLFGVEYAAPIGIAPVGLDGLIWPGAGAALASTAAASQIPYVMSMVSTETPEVIGPRVNGMGWFQLYSPRDSDIRDRIIERVAKAGFTTLVVTADVPSPSRRERQRAAGIGMPPVINLAMIVQAALHPAWAFGVLRKGTPRLQTLEEYAGTRRIRGMSKWVGENLGGTLSWDYLSEVRELWQGPLVVKGILDPEDAKRCVDAGADAVYVSNHGGRQLEAAPAAISTLQAVVDRVGSDVPVLFDSGIRSGADVARAIALGASFVFCGRAFMFGVAALGPRGGCHAFEILKDGLINVMHQTGCRSLEELSERLVR